MQILEVVILRRSRDVYERYAGKEHHDFPIPLDDVTIESLTEDTFRIFGGRLPDVLKFVTRVKATRKSPHEVLKAMELEAEAEILNRAFGKKIFKIDSPGSWTQTQAWKCIRDIAKAESSGFSVPMQTVLLKVFKGDQKALDELLSTGVVCVVESKVGGQMMLEAGSPLYLHQFKHMVHNPTINKGFEQACLDEDYKKYNDEASNLEDDLCKIGKSINVEMVSGREGINKRKEQLSARLGELTELIIENRKVKSRL